MLHNTAGATNLTAPKPDDMCSVMCNFKLVLIHGGVSQIDVPPSEGASDDVAFKLGTLSNVFFPPPLKKKKLQKHFYLKVTSRLFHSARLSGPSPPSLFHHRSTGPDVAQPSLTVASHPGDSCFSKTPLSISSALFLRPPSSSLCTSHSSSSHIVTNLSRSLLFPAPLSLSLRSISNASACSSSLRLPFVLLFIFHHPRLSLRVGVGVAPAPLPVC